MNFPFQLLFTNDNIHTSNQESSMAVGFHLAYEYLCGSVQLGPVHSVTVVILVGESDTCK